MKWCSLIQTIVLVFFFFPELCLLSHASWLAHWLAPLLLCSPTLWTWCEPGWQSQPKKCEHISPVCYIPTTSILLCTYESLSVNRLILVCVNPIMVLPLQWNGPLQFTSITRCHTYHIYWLMMTLFLHTGTATSCTSSCGSPKRKVWRRFTEASPPLSWVSSHMQGSHFSHMRPWRSCTQVLIISTFYFLFMSAFSLHCKYSDQ